MLAVSLITILPADYGFLFPVFCRDPWFASYLYVTLRSLFLNNLTLEMALFVFIHLLPRSVCFCACGVINGGLNYLWSGLSLAENVMVSWIANNTHVQGDLDSLE